MPKILFASNNVSHFPGSVPGSVAGTFEPSRVPYAVLMSNFQLISPPDFSPSSLTTTWFHFRTHTDGNGYGIPSGASGTLFQCFDGLNRRIVRIYKKNLDYAQDLTIDLSNGSSTLTVNGTLPLTQSKMTPVDVLLTITSVLVRVDVYVNGSLTGFLQFGSNPNTLTNPIRFSLGCSHTESLSMGQAFSEIIVSEGDTRNARMNFLRPVSTGAFSQWDGTISALGDDDPTTGLYTKVAAERHTMGLSTYTGAQNISNLVSVSQTTRGLNSPTKLKHTFRLGGVNYDSPDLNIGYGLQYNIVDSSINPATSLPWTSDDLSTLETGFLSVA
jgi:hypothetical protein